jgi:hypothetical protein
MAIGLGLGVVIASRQDQVRERELKPTCEELEDWRRCRENRTPAKIDRLAVNEDHSMYWDVVEVKPEPGYNLFVQFKDGLSGRIQLRREELTGALAPLQDAGFFQQVFIDSGAVAWPGEIDLAPDAMYARISNQLRRQEPTVSGKLDR